MILIRRSVPWVQPQRRPPLDRQHPLLRGAISVGTIVHGAPFDLWNNVALTPTGVTGGASTFKGNAATTAANSTDVWTADFPVRTLTDRIVCSVVAVCYSASSNTTRKRAIRIATAGGSALMNIDFADGSTNQLVGGAQVTGAIFPTAIVSGVTVANRIYSLAMVKELAAQKLYVDGLDATTSVVGGVGAVMFGDASRINIGNSASANPLNGGVLFWAAYNRDLVAREVMALHMNPWQVFGRRILAVRR
jgi:hypothetical protein